MITTAFSAHPTTAENVSDAKVLFGSPTKISATHPRQSGGRGKLNV
jgi:hypothetical protein